MSRYIFLLIPIINLNASILLGAYAIGDTISVSDQEIPYEICYGEYANDTYKVGDANYLINGGSKKITIMKLSAAW